MTGVRFHWERTPVFHAKQSRTSRGASGSACQKSPPARSSGARTAPAGAFRSATAARRRHLARRWRRNKTESRHFRGRKVNCPEGAREGPLGACTSEMTLLAKVSPTISQEIETKLSCNPPRKSGCATFSTVSAGRPVGRPAGYSRKPPFRPSRFNASWRRFLRSGPRGGSGPAPGSSPASAGRTAR